MFKKKFFWVIISTVLAFAIYGVILFDVGSRATKDTSVKSDAIIILGARAKINNKINVCLENRVIQGVQIYKKGLATKIILSGGNEQAEVMKQVALMQNVPAKDIFLERTSLNTYENLVNSKKIMNDHHFQSAIIVSDAFHEPRASMVASKLGIVHSVSPAVHSPCWTNGKYFSLFTLREPLAIIVYKIQNKL